MSLKVELPYRIPAYAPSILADPINDIESDTISF